MRLSKQLTKREGKSTLKIKEEKEYNEDKKEEQKGIEKEEKKEVKEEIKKEKIENTENIVEKQEKEETIEKIIKEEKEIKSEPKKKNNEKLSKDNEDKNKYINKIKELEEKIKIINLQYGNEIKKKEKDIKKLVTTNSNLKNSLELLTQRLDKVLINKNIQKIKKPNIITENNKDDLQYQLEIKEKELKNQQQLINILKNDNKNIRNILSTFGYNENSINLVEKVNQQYKDLLNLQKNFKEYKEKHSSSQININSKKINSLNEENKKKNKKLVLNSLSPTGHNCNTTKNKNLDINKKKHEYHGISSSFHYNKENNNSESIFTENEKKVIKNFFNDEENYQNFINKISILEKSSIVKEKEMIMKIKLMENKLKEKDKENEDIKKESKEKDNIIIALNVQNKELKKTVNELITKINLLTKTINELEEKNQLILKKNKEFQNTIFNIDGIIEAKSKKGDIIPILKEVNINIEKTKKEETNHSKNGSNSPHQTNKEEKNKNLNITNSNSELGSDNL